MSSAVTSSAASSSGPSQNIVSTLGAGSGIDIQSLAQKLVAAEQQPREKAINDKLSKTEARISGYGALKAAVSDLKAAFEKIDDATEFSSLTTSGTQPSSFSVTTGPNAAAGGYDVQVVAVAQAQRSVADFPSRSAALNGGSSFQLTVTDSAGASRAVNVATATPAGMVSAINSAGLDVSAQLIDTGTGVKVVLTGKEGATGAFTVSTSGPGMSFSQIQTARDASLVLNGISVTRPSNTISDVLDGVTFKLYNPTSGTARLEMTRDTSGITSKLQELVSAYNTFQESVKVLGDRASSVETFGGALAGEALLRNVGEMVRRLITDPSTSPGTSVKAPRDVCLSIDRFGKMSLDTSKLATVLQKNFDDVVKMFTAGADAKSPYSVAPAGSAGEAVKKLAGLLRSDNLIDQQTQSAEKQVTEYKAQLTKLQDRMKQMLDRYVAQFAAMDSIVGASTNTRTSLKSTFEAMNARNSS